MNRSVVAELNTDKTAEAEEDRERWHRKGRSERRLVLTATFPVIAPVSTVAVICVPELTVKVVAFTPPNDTCVAPIKPEPVIVTCMPTGPLLGVKLLTTGVIWYLLLLVSVPAGVVTVTYPVVPFAGTTAVMYVSLTTAKLADPEPKLTLVAPVRPVPRI